MRTITLAKENPAPVAAGSGAKSQSHAIFADNSTDSPAAKLLPLLEGARQTGPGRWVAKCPAHDDRRPSLSLREGNDGRLLVHCWAGCHAAEIVAAVGLTLADLFERPITHHAPAERRPWRDAGLEVLRALADEVAVVFVMAALLAGGLELTDADRERLTLAAERVNGALVLIEGGRAHG